MSFLYSQYVHKTTLNAQIKKGRSKVKGGLFLFNGITEAQ